MKRILFAAWLIIGVTVLFSFGQVDSQWRGPKRDGVYPNEKLLKKWPAEGPKLLWFVDGLGEGFSSPAVTGNRVYLTGMIKGEGFVFAFDIKKGKFLWKASYGPEWDDGYPGSRTTPTVVGNRIYVITARGRCVCLDDNGKTVWSVDLIKDFDARNIKWGITESVVVDGDRLFCTPGGPEATLAILNRHSGKVIKKIKATGDKSGYCSPLIVKHGKRKLLLTMTGESVVGLDADSGDFLWSAPHKTRYDINPNTPLYKDGFVYTVSGYGTGGQMFKLSADGKKAERVWEQKKLDSQMGSVIATGGYIYGSGHTKRGWHCLDWKTGEVQYTSKEVGSKGNIVFSDGMLYCYGENGEMALVKPNPKQFEVVSSFKIEKGTEQHWAHPVIKKGRLYIRHGDTMMVYDIAR